MRPEMPLDTGHRMHVDQIASEKSPSHKQSRAAAIGYSKPCSHQQSEAVESCRKVENRGEFETSADGHGTI